MDSLSPDTTGPPKDIFHEPPEDIFSDPLSNINSEPQKNVKIQSPGSDEAVDLLSDPLDDEADVISSPEVQNPVPDLLKEPVETPKSDVIGKAPSDISSKPVHKNAIGVRHQDIFEDPPTGSKGSAAKKPGSAELFGDEDDEEDEEEEEDLFKEPLKGMTKKPQPSVASGPPINVFTEVKSEVKVKPHVKDDPTDLFAEEAVTAPATKPSSGGSSRTNGVHSEEQDIFSGTVTPDHDCDTFDCLPRPVFWASFESL